MGRAIKKRTAGAAGRLKNSNFAQAWLILVLALIFGSALAAVQVNLSGVIAANKLNETLERVPELVFGETAAAGMTSPNATVEITPGTVTIRLSKDKLTVHALSKEAASELATGAMSEEISNRVFKQ